MVFLSGYVKYIIGDCYKVLECDVYNKTMSYYSIALLVVLLLIAPVHLLCLNPIEPDGLCSACVPELTLTYGYCCQKLEGCLKRISPSLCG
jgi:hypothetical protein